MAYYVSNKICFNAKNCISNEMENIFIELLIPKTKPITAGIICKPVNILNTVNILNEEWHILGDLNINLCENSTLVRENNKNIVKCTDKTSLKAKRYLELCKTFGFKQILKSPTRVTLSTSSLIDHILKNTNEKIAQCGLINVGLSDHQMIFCTRKTKKRESRYS